jgi:hypothetical protein
MHFIVGPPAERSAVSQNRRDRVNPRGSEDAFGPLSGAFPSQIERRTAGRADNRQARRSVRGFIKESPTETPANTGKDVSCGDGDTVVTAIDADDACGDL